MSKSRAYAERDGIKIEKGRARGGKLVDIYLVPCDKCGRIIKKIIYNGDRNHYCEYCKSNITKEKRDREQAELDEVMTRRKQAFQKAIEKVILQVDDISEYEEHINKAYTNAEQYGSIPEVIAAIELIKLGYSIIPQKKVSRYRVDFLLPNEKLVIEIDGELYHNDLQYESERDITIRLKLKQATGEEWRIIHIPAEIMYKNMAQLKNIIKYNLQQQGKK